MFYTYVQNNSGGRMDESDKLARYVIIEAQSPRHADGIAEDLGIYFNGVKDGRDCRCCGDRWDHADAGNPMPSKWDEPITEIGADMLLYLADGRVLRPGDAVDLPLTQEGKIQQMQELLREIYNVIDCVDADDPLQHLRERMLEAMGRKV